MGVAGDPGWVGGITGAGWAEDGWRPWEGEGAADGGTQAVWWDVRWGGRGGWALGVHPSPARDIYGTCMILWHMHECTQQAGEKLPPTNPSIVHTLVPGGNHTAHSIAGVVVVACTIS